MFHISVILLFNSLWKAQRAEWYCPDDFLFLYVNLVMDTVFVVPNRAIAVDLVEDKDMVALPSQVVSTVEPAVQYFVNGIGYPVLKVEMKLLLNPDPGTEATVRGSYRIASPGSNHLIEIGFNVNVFRDVDVQIAVDVFAVVMAVGKVLRTSTQNSAHLVAAGPVSGTGILFSSKHLNRGPAKDVAWRWGANFRGWGGVERKGTAKSHLHNPSVNRRRSGSIAPVSNPLKRTDVNDPPSVIPFNDVSVLLGEVFEFSPFL